MEKDDHPNDDIIVAVVRAQKVGYATLTVSIPVRLVKSMDIKKGDHLIVYHTPKGILYTKQVDKHAMAAWLSGNRYASEKAAGAVGQVPEDPTALVPIIACKASISAQTQQRAIGIIAEAREKGIAVDKKPHEVAAAALFIACNFEQEWKKKAQIAEAAQVNTDTVEQYASDLAAHM